MNIPIDWFNRLELLRLELLLLLGMPPCWDPEPTRLKLVVNLFKHGTHLSCTIAIFSFSWFARSSVHRKWLYFISSFFSLLSSRFSTMSISKRAVKPTIRFSSSMARNLARRLSMCWRATRGTWLPSTSSTDLAKLDLLRKRARMRRVSPSTSLYSKTGWRVWTSMSSDLSHSWSSH